MEIKRKPIWLKKRLPSDAEYEKIGDLFKKSCLNTVCQEAKCPNIWECFARHTATFLIMGRSCTRNCRFCAVGHDKNPPLPDKDEPARIAEVAEYMKLDYIVITSVTRDDLPDGGAFCFADTINAIKKNIPKAKIEILIPDFLGDKKALKSVLRAEPDVLNHNIETVKRLYSDIRPGASYERSLMLFENVREISPDIPIKSGIMLGLGESDKEIKDTLKDVFDAGCGIITIGQYLQPSKAHAEVKEFVLPEKFEYWEKKALLIGFLAAASGPFVRSSYNAKQLYNKVKIRVKMKLDK